MKNTLEIVTDVKSILGEGPCWDEQNQLFYWIDILGNKIHSYNLSDHCVVSMTLDQNIGCVAIREKGGLIAAMQNGFYFIDNLHETWQKITDPEADKPNNRFNDGKCDTLGRLWAGTMSKDLDSGYGENKPEGSLYCLNSNLSLECKIKGVTLSNGIGWSPDNQTMYYIDTPTMVVTAYDFDVITGGLGNTSQVVIIPKSLGIPDGMCVDEEGMLWIALWGGGAVSRFDPHNGKLLETIKVPVLNVSSCTFGGENMDELYITTASIGTNKNKYPNAGGLFKIKPGVAGLISNKFKG